MATSKKSKKAAPLPEPSLPLAVVDWLDAFWDSDEVALKKLRKPSRPWPMTTVGFVVQDDEDGIMLVHEINVKKQTGHGSTFIPRGMVKKVRRVKA